MSGMTISATFTADSLKATKRSNMRSWVGILTLQITAGCARHLNTGSR